MKYLQKLLLITLLTSSGLWAQSASTAQISGLVRDASGAAIPGARIVVTQTDTGVTRNTQSGADGAYVLPSLPVGPYRLEVSQDGFNTYVQAGIVLQVNTNPSIVATLAVGAVSEQIVVQADAAMVETQSTGVGVVIDQQRVVELPLNGRSPTQLITLAGGASTTPVYQNLNSTKNYPGQEVVSVAGGQTNGMTYLLDGATHNDPFNNLNLQLPFPDALQEFKVETSALTAQYGYHSAGTVNAVTKSGSNEYHGDLFWFVRNASFNARDFFAPTRDTLKRNQFGGTFGGPIQKDKLFFFVGIQTTIQRSAPTTAFSFVPTPQTLAGDFTAMASAACNSGREISLGAPFANNKISPTMYSPAALKMMTYYQPLPTDPCGRVQYGLFNNYNENSAVGRIDYQIAPNHSFFGRYSVADFSKRSSYDGTQISLQQPGFEDMINSVVLGDTYVFGAGTVNSFRATLNRSAVVKAIEPFFTPPDLGVRGFTVLLPGFTRIVINNAFESSCNICPRGDIFLTTFQLSDDVSMVRGSHQISFGVNWIRPAHNSILNGLSPGTFTFTGQITGLAMADFLTGNLGTFAQGNSQRTETKNPYLGFYIQDSWRVNSRLKLNYGVRWEPYFGPSWKRDRLNRFDQALFDQGVKSTVYPNAPAGVEFLGDPGFSDTGRSPFYNKWAVFAPRLGAIWDPQGDGRMTVRASWGMFNEQPHTLFWDDYSRSSPWGQNVSLQRPPGGFDDPWQGFPGGSPFPSSLGADATFPVNGYWQYTPKDLKTTYINQWNLTIQRQIGADWLASASYMGNSTIHLFTNREATPAVYIPGQSCVLGGVTYSPCSSLGNTLQRRVLTLQNPDQGKYFGALNLLDDGGTASYHGLLLSLQHRFAKNFTLLGNYTWSHCISDLVTTEFAGPAYTNSNDRRFDRGNCRFVDVRHIFNLSAVVNTPRFGNRMTQAVAGDWQLGVITGYKSGLYYNVTSGIDHALSGIPQQRANQVLDDVYCSNRGPDCWLNPKAFAVPATGTLGNMGQNSVIGPNFLSVDISLTRNFNITESHQVQIRAEAFNLQNRANFNTPTRVAYPAGPDAPMNNSTFGRITQANPARIMQFAVKYRF